MDKIRKKRTLKVLLFIILNISYLVATLFLYIAVVGTNIKAEITTRYDNDTYFIMFYTNKSQSIYNDDMASRVDPMEVNGFTKIPFVLNTKDITGLKLHLGHKDRRIELKEIVVRSAFKQVVFKANDIKNIFNNVSKDIKSIEVKEDILNIQPDGRNPYISSENMAQIMNNAPYNLKVIIPLVLFSIVMTVITFMLYSYFKKGEISPRRVVFALIFMVMICVPNIALVLGIGSETSTENRGSPIIEGEGSGAVERMIKTFEARYNDNFGFRNLLIKMNALIDTKIFKKSPTEKVVIGKEDWLFYKKDDTKDLSEDYRGNMRFTDEELKKIKENLERKRDWLEEQKIPFVLMITPNKSSIYGEYYDESYKKVSNQTRLDQLLDYLNKNSDIEIVDIRKTLIDKKSEQRLYHKTDTHWNQYGAYYGYRDLMNTMHKYIPELSPLSLDDFNLVKEFRKPGEGDLANMIGLPERYGEEHILLQPKEERKSKPVENDHYDLIRGDILKNPDKNKPKLLMYRDSFAVSLVPYIAEHFSESVYEWSYNFNGILIEQIQPDIVVQQIVEGKLEKLLLENQGYVK